MASAFGALTAGLGGAGGFGSIFTQVLSSVLSSAMSPSAPSSSPLPAAPQVQQTPPAPGTSSAADVANSDALSAEEVRVRNLKRRQASQREGLINLRDTEDSTSLTKSLLGE